MSFMRSRKSARSGSASAWWAACWLSPAVSSSSEASKKSTRFNWVQNRPLSRSRRSSNGSRTRGDSPTDRADPFLAQGETGDPGGKGARYGQGGGGRRRRDGRERQGIG